MVTIQQCWLWSFALLFIIRIDPSCSSPSISRLNGVVADPLAELKVSSCSQQLEKLKMETRRHVSALNAITDSSMSAAWRNRRLLSTIQPIESKFKSNFNTLLSPGSVVESPVRVPAKTEEDVKNPLVKYLSSLDHNGWVKKCLAGGKCSMTDSHNEETEKRASEPPGIMSDRKNVSESLTKIDTQKSTNENNFTVQERVGEINKLTNDTILLNMSPQQDVSDLINKLNRTESNRIIDLLPSGFEPLNESGSIITSRPRVEDRLMITHQNYTSLSNQSVIDHNSNVSGILDDKSGTQIDASLENTNKPIEYAEDRKIQFRQKGSVDPETVSFSSLISNKDTFSSDLTADFVMPEDQKLFLIDSLRYLPNTDRLVRYNNNFLPLTIHFTPITYYQRYPRGGKVSENEVLGTSSGIEKTFFPNSEVQAPNFDHPSQQLLHSNGNGLTDEKIHEIGSLDNLVANYGNDIFKRGSTGKRESEHSNPKKEAVTTNYPEVPSSYTSAITADGQIFNRVAPVENGTDSNIYLFVGGNWVANFKDNPRLFYIQPQPRQPVRPQPFTETMENSFGSQQQSHQPSSSTNPKCPSDDRILASPTKLNLPTPYSQPSYAVDEKNYEWSGVPSIVNNARAANIMKVPSMVAARNGYEWYDYDTMTNDVYARPMNGPLSGGPRTFPNAVEFSRIPDENRKGAYRPETDNLNYEDSLVNFPPPKYEPPLVGSHDASVVKPEEFKEHDIDVPDMFVVGTQLLAALPLMPSEHHANENDVPYGQLVADVSSRSPPEMKSSLPKNPPLRAFKAHESINWPGVRSDIQVPSTYFSTSQPNDFEFVSGQWVKRKPESVMSGQGFIYDQVGQRRIRDIVVGWPGINNFNYIQQPSPPSKSTCFSESKRLDKLHVLRNHILPQEGQPAYP